MGRNLEEIYIQSGGHSGGHSGDHLVRWESDGIARWPELVLPRIGSPRRDASNTKGFLAANEQTNEGGTHLTKQ